MRHYVYTDPFVSVQPLGATRLYWPPEHTRQFLEHGMPTLLDERVCEWEFLTVDRCPNERHVVFREPVAEGTVFRMGEYGQAERWPKTC
jgi:hypothetical protein